MLIDLRTGSRCFGLVAGSIGGALLPNGIAPCQYAALRLPRQPPARPIDQTSCLWPGWSATTDPFVLGSHRWTSTPARRY